MKTTILITGGAGFIGSHLVDAYLDQGYEVVVVDDLSTGKKENVNPGAVFYELSLLDLGLIDVFRRHRPKIINHHAAQASVRLSVDDPARDAEINVLGSIKLLELAGKHGAERFIFASSGGAIYGEPAYFPPDEDHPQRPVSPYGAAKASVELYLNFYRAEYGLNCTALRYANVYGPRQDPFGEAGVVAIFASRMLQGEQPIINGDGLQTRDYVYVGDVVAANLAAVKSVFSGALNIGTGVETSVLALFGLLKEAAKSACEPEFGPAKPGEQRRSVLDASSAKQELGWVPKMPLAEGLRKTVEYFKSDQRGAGETK